MNKVGEKLIVYLDQNCLSDMAKIGKNSNVRPEIKELYNILHKGFLDEKIIVPSSWFHKIETCLIPELKEEIENRQAWMGQISLRHKDHIYLTQLEQGLDEFNRKIPYSGILDYTTAFDNHPDTPTNYLHVTVDSHLENIHNTENRESLASDIERVRKTVLMNRVTFKEQFSAEIEAYASGFLYKPSFGLLGLHHMYPDKNILKNFSKSHNFKKLPTVNIGSKLWAYIFTSATNRSTSRGDSTDVDVISSYLPYVDIMVVDTFMAHNISTLKLDKDYQTLVYDTKTKSLTKLIQYLKGYLSSAEPAYKPKVSIFIIPDGKIKADSLNFCNKLGKMASRHDVKLFIFDDDNMQKYIHKDSGIEMPFCGLYEYTVFNKKDVPTKKNLPAFCENKSRSDKFIILDHHRNLKDNFCDILLKNCRKGKTTILNYPIYDKQETSTHSKY